MLRTVAFVVVEVGLVAACAGQCSDHHNVSSICCGISPPVVANAGANKSSTCAAPIVTAESGAAEWDAANPELELRAAASGDGTLSPTLDAELDAAFEELRALLGEGSGGARTADLDAATDELRGLLFGDNDAGVPKWRDILVEEEGKLSAEELLATIKHVVANSQVLSQMRAEEMGTSVGDSDWALDANDEEAASASDVGSDDWDEL